MRLRKRTDQPTPRQRLRSEEVRRGPSAFSYHARRSEARPNTGRNLQREAIKAGGKRLGAFWRNRFGVLILLAALLIFVINSLSLSSNVKIESLAADGQISLLQDSSVYQRTARQLLERSFWNHIKPTADTDSVAAGLERQYPELSGVSLTLPLIAHKPVVYLEPAVPALILSAPNGSFVLDTAGKALISADSLQSSVAAKLPFVSDQSNLSVQVNHQALSASSVTFIRTVTAQLQARNVAVSSMTLPSGASELDVSLKGVPYFAKFNLQSDTARQQAGTFLATQAQLKKQGITPASYIDVRVDGRAYYR